MIGDSTMGLLFRIQSDSSQVKSDVQNLNQVIESETSAAGSKFGELASSVGDSLSSIGGAITSLGTTLTAGLTVPLLALGTAAIKTFADVQLAVAQISTIKPEINLGELESALNQMSTRIPQTAQQLGDGLYNIFSSINVSQTEGLKLLEQFGKGATAAQTDASTFGTAVLGVMNAYKLSVSDASHITDVFFNTVNLGVVNGQELATQLGEVTQSAKNAGVGLNELGALIVGVTKEGGEASKNINNLSGFLQKLPTKEAAAALKTLGVEVQKNGQFRPTIEVLGDLKAKLDELSPAAKALAIQKIFPDEQARTGALTLMSQLDAVKEALKVNETTAGAAEKAYSKIAATASVQFSLLKNSIVAILAELGSVLLPVLQPVIDWIAQTLVPAISSVVQYLKSLSPEIQTVIVAIAGIVAAAGPVLVVIGTVITFIGGIIAAIGTAVSAVAAAGGVMAILGAAVAAVIVSLKVLIPVALAVGAAILALVAVGAALYAAWVTDFGGLRTFTLQAWEAIKSAFKTGYDFIYNLVVQVGGSVVGWWKENYPLIRDTIIAVSEAIKTYIQGFLSAIKGFWEAHGAAISTYISTYWNVIKAAISTGMTYLGDIIKIALNLIKGDWEVAWTAVLSFLQNAGRNITTTVLKIKDLIVAAIGALLPLIADWGGRFLKTAGEWALKIVGGVVYIIATLPQRLVELVPKFFAAMWDIGAAIWRGIKEGWNKGAEENPIVIPQPETSGGGVGGANLSTVNFTPGQGTKTSTTSGGGGTGDKDAADKRRKEAEENQKRDLAARLQILQGELQKEETAYNETLDKIRENFKNTGDKDVFLKAAQDALTDYRTKIGETLTEINSLENQQAEIEKKRASELDALRQAQTDRQDELQKKLNQSVDDNNKLLNEGQKAQITKSIALTEAEAQRKLELEKTTGNRILAEKKSLLDKGLIDEFDYAKAVANSKLNILELEKTLIKSQLDNKNLEVEKRAELDQRLKILDEELTLQMIENADKLTEAYKAVQSAKSSALAPPAEGEKGEPDNPAVATEDLGFLGSLLGGAGFNIEDMLKPIDILAEAGKMLGSVFSDVAQAVGNAVKSFVLFGTAGGSFRKFAAEMIASIAQMAAVQAVWEAAQALAMAALFYFTGNPAYALAATAHSSAAVVYGIIAGVAAVAGRVVAGDVFKDKTSASAAFGSSTNQATGRDNRSTQGGSVYSKYGDESTIVENGRNTPSYANRVNQMVVTLKVRSNDSHIIDVIHDDVNNNGKTRNLIIDTASS